MAASTTSDATGDYYLYDFLTDGTNFVDYPHTGVWPDGYYMSAHVFNAAGTSYLAGRVYAGVPAPTNLPVPPHSYLTDTRIRIGEDIKAA